MAQRRKWSCGVFAAAAESLFIDVHVSPLEPESTAGGPAFFAATAPGMLTGSVAPIAVAAHTRNTTNRRAYINGSDAPKRGDGSSGFQRPFLCMGNPQSFPPKRGLWQKRLALFGRYFFG